MLATPNLNCQCGCHIIIFYTTVSSDLDGGQNIIDFCNKRITGNKERGREGKLTPLNFLCNVVSEVFANSNRL